MAGKVLNIRVCIPLNLRNGLTGNDHAICHYSYNLPLAASEENETATLKPDYKIEKTDRKY